MTNLEIYECLSVQLRGLQISLVLYHHPTKVLLSGIPALTSHSLCKEHSTLYIQQRDIQSAPTKVYDEYVV